MNLISKDVKVYGVPNFEVINYNDWYKQCEKEFEDMLLSQISYQDLKILTESPDLVKFVAVEITEAKDGHKNIYCIEFIIQKEVDGQWRVVEERILPEDVLDREHSA